MTMSHDSMYLLLTLFTAMISSLMLLSAPGSSLPPVEEIAANAEHKYGALDPLIPPGMATPTARALWATKSRAIRTTLLQYIGSFPASTLDLSPRIIREEKLDGYTRIKVRYLVEPHEDAVAYLLVPDGITTGTPRAAVLVLHQTQEAAKEEICGIQGKQSMHYGLDLVRRGYVVLAPDSITAGERVYSGFDPFVTKPFDEANPQWSAIGKMIWDHRRALDYLSTLPYVDMQRIGVVGHSLGAYNAFFLAAFDERVRAVVESCGYATIASDEGRERWARTSWFVHIPRLRPFVEPGSKMKSPFDFHEVLGLIAPCPLLQCVGLKDEIFTSCDSAAQVHLELEKIYSLFGKKENLESYFFDGPHDFPPEAKRRAWEFLDKHLLEYHQ